jgi:branched-chain amino acid transport system substrate-binding protein
MTRIHPFSFIPAVLCAILLLSGCTGGKTVWNAPAATTVTTATPAPNGPAPVTPAPAAINPYPVNTAGDKAKVAILLPLSGTNAALGQAMLSAAQLAMFDTGAENFELMPRDSGATAQSAAEAAQAALNDGAQLILGPLFADAVKAVKPVAAQRGVQVIAFSTDTAAAGGNTFLMGFTPASQVSRIARFAGAKGIRTAAILSGTDAYGDTATKSFTDLAPGAGISLSQTLRYNPAETAMKARVAALTNGVQAVFMPLSGTHAAEAAGYMTAPGLKKLGTGLWDDARALSAPVLDGAWFAAPSPASFSVFEKKFRMTYGSTPPRLASIAYDAAALAAVLSRSGKGFGTGAITNPNGFAGMDGIFRFGADGVAERGLAVLEIRKGQAVEIDPAPKTF